MFSSNVRLSLVVFGVLAVGCTQQPKEDRKVVWRVMRVAARERCNDGVAYAHRVEVVTLDE